MNEIHTYLKTVSASAPLSCHNLTLFPLVGSAIEPDYLMLGDALQSGVARIEEVSEGGSVPELRFLNAGDRPVFMLDGEEVTGAKQNRILNVSILAGQGETLLPVSCVEAGRWRHTSREFRESDRTLFASGRARKARRVSESMRSHRGKSSNQGEVWDDIAEKSMRMEAHSSTGAAEEIYRKHHASLEDFVRDLQVQPGQTGAAFAINGRLIGMDLFDTEYALGKSLPKLVRSYALDAMDRASSDHFETSDAGLDQLISGLLDAVQERHAGVGLGEDVRFSSKHLEGGALVHQERVVHLCAYRLREESGAGEGSGRGRTSRDTSIARASRRRELRGHEMHRPHADESSDERIREEIAKHIKDLENGSDEPMAG